MNAKVKAQEEKKIAEEQIWVKLKKKCRNLEYGSLGVNIKVHQGIIQEVEILRERETIR